MISWVNPDERHAGKSFENYMLEGPLDALDQIEKATGETSVNAIGYCLGGTLLASTLAYLASKMAARTGSHRVATFFTTMTDFSDAGEMSVFIDEEQIASIEETMAEKGYLEGTDDGVLLQHAARQRPDLVVRGQQLPARQGPAPVRPAVLEQRQSTRMPAAMHSFYLRNMYLKNLLAKPGGISLEGVPIDLRRIETPSFFLSAREDHIAPWKSTYSATQVFSGPVKFVLSASGHIAGVVNPPAANKYCYWTGADLPAGPDTGWMPPSAPKAPGGRNGTGGSASAPVARFRHGNPEPERSPFWEEAPGSYVAARIT